MVGTLEDWVDIQRVNVVIDDVAGAGAGSRVDSLLQLHDFMLQLLHLVNVDVGWRLAEEVHVVLGDADGFAQIRFIQRKHLGRLVPFVDDVLVRMLLDVRVLVQEPLELPVEVTLDHVEDAHASKILDEPSGTRSDVIRRSDLDEVHAVMERPDLPKVHNALERKRIDQRVVLALLCDVLELVGQGIELDLSLFANLLLFLELLCRLVEIVLASLADGLKNVSHPVLEWLRNWLA